MEPQKLPTVIREHLPKGRRDVGEPTKRLELLYRSEKTICQINKVNMKKKKAVVNRKYVRPPYVRYSLRIMVTDYMFGVTTCVRS